MRIRAVVSATLASVGILVAGWQSGTHVTTTSSAVGTAVQAAAELAEIGPLLEDVARLASGPNSSSEEEKKVQQDAYGIF